MKRYSKPILDIVEFDNLDVVVMSGNTETSGQSLDDESNSIAIHNELILNQSDASSAPAVATEAPAPTESAPLEAATPEPTPDETADEPVDDTGVADLETAEDVLETSAGSDGASEE